MADCDVVDGIYIVSEVSPQYEDESLGAQQGGDEEEEDAEEDEDNESKDHAKASKKRRSGLLTDRRPCRGIRSPLAHRPHFLHSQSPLDS